MKLSEMDKFKLQAGARYVQENVSKLDGEDFAFVRRIFDKVTHAIWAEQQDRDTRDLIYGMEKELKKEGEKNG